MKEKERKEKEADKAVELPKEESTPAQSEPTPTAPLGLSSNGQLDEIQLFKLMMRKEAEKTLYQPLFLHVFVEVPCLTNLVQCSTSTVALYKPPPPSSRLNVAC